MWNAETKRFIWLFGTRQNEPHCLSPASGFHSPHSPHFLLIQKDILRPKHQALPPPTLQRAWKAAQAPQAHKSYSFGRDVFCCFPTSTLNSAWASLIYLGMSRMADLPATVLTVRKQCQLCLREHRLHFHVHHPANTIKMPVKHRKKILKNLRWVKRQELPEWSQFWEPSIQKPPLSTEAVQALRLLCLRLHGRQQCWAGQSPGSTQVKCPTERLYFWADISQLLKGKLPDREKEEWLMGMTYKVTRISLEQSLLAEKHFKLTLLCPVCGKAPKYPKEANPGPLWGSESQSRCHAVSP